jgi:hypothetical protein
VISDVKTMLSGDDGFTAKVKNPMEFAAAPFASGVPTVRNPDDCAGGLHDGKASGGPWVRFAAAQAL